MFFWGDIATSAAAIVPGTLISLEVNAATVVPVKAAQEGASAGGNRVVLHVRRLHTRGTPMMNVGALAGIPSSVTLFKTTRIHLAKRLPSFVAVGRLSGVLSIPFVSSSHKSSVRGVYGVQCPPFLPQTFLCYSSLACFSLACSSLNLFSLSHFLPCLFSIVLLCLLPSPLRRRTVREKDRSRFPRSEWL